MKPVISLMLAAVLVVLAADSASARYWYGRGASGWHGGYYNYRHRYPVSRYCSQRGTC